MDSWRSRWPIDNLFRLSEARESFVRLFTPDVEGHAPTWHACAALLSAGGSLFVAGGLGVASVTGPVDQLHGRNRRYLLLTAVEAAFEKLVVLPTISALLLQRRSLTRIEVRVGD